MASTGCYSGEIKNGFVATSSCQVFNSRAYCRYYCYHGFVKTAANVYCAGNDKWIPSGSHSSQDYQACRPDTDQDNPCDDIFFNNGYIVTCPESHGGNKKDCMYKCNKGYKPASSSVHCVRNQWLTSDTYSEPCVSDGSIVKPSATTRRPAVMTTMSPRTTYPGYYDDPNLKMDVSPIVFVGAVIGGLLAIGLLIFAIFFRAHKKTRREARARSMFIVACDPLSAQNDYTNNNADTPVNDPQYREVARRIIAQSQRQSTHSPPPYDPNSSNINPDVQNTFNGPSAPPYPAMQSPIDEIHDIPSPPYTTTYNSGHGNQDPLLYTANDQLGIFQLDNTRYYDHSTAHEINSPNNNPPTYEEVQNCTKNFTDEQTIDNNFDPPPPYTTDGGKR